jgi:hypothetical protein
MTGTMHRPLALAMRKLGAMTLWCLSKCGWTLERGQIHDCRGEYWVGEGGLCGVLLG